MNQKTSIEASDEFCGTSYAAKLLDLSVGTVQSLVEKNELMAWKTQGGHRRISIQSIRDYQRRNNYIANPHIAIGDRLKVVVVEDDAVTLKLFSEQFDSWNMPLDPMFFNTAMNAMMDLPVIQPQLLLTDLLMPGLDGFELLNAMSKHPRLSQVVVVVVTAMSQSEIDARGGLPKGVQVLFKPVDMGWLRGYFHALINVGKIAQNSDNLSRSRRM